MYEFKKVGNQLVIKITPEESRAIKHKLEVFQKHWYQLELKENGLGNIYANLIDRQDLMLVSVRDSLNELDESTWITRINNLLAGFISNIYLVTKGVIFEPHMHPNNFVYSPAVSRILTFYRKDSHLKVISQEFYEEVYKMVAFLLSKAPVEHYNEMSIVDIEDYMELHQYMLFMKLLEEESIDNLVKYFLSDTDIDRLGSYLTIVPEGEPAYVRELGIKITWTNIKFAQTLADKKEEEREEREVVRKRKKRPPQAQRPSGTGSSQRKRRPTNTSQQKKRSGEPPRKRKGPQSVLPKEVKPNKSKKKRNINSEGVPKTLKTRKKELSKEERIQRVREMNARNQKELKVRMRSESDDIIKRRKMPTTLKVMIGVMFILIAFVIYLFYSGVM